MSDQVTELKAAVSALLEGLPKCGYSCDDGCKEIATFICFDATGDVVYRCGDHKFTGGMLDEDPPVPARWAKAVEQALAALK